MFKNFFLVKTDQKRDNCGHFLRGNMKKSELILWMVIFLTSSACSSSSSSTSSCTEGSGDFYVVENASCTDGEGKLSRINPDEICKEEILTELNCPVDFVLSSEDAGIGYLSTQTDGVMQVDLNAKTSFVIQNTVTVAATGLFLMENVTDTENEDLCGGNTLTDAILFVADEGIDESGAVLRWCLVSDDPDNLASNNPDPVVILSTAFIENPRGITVKDRTTVYVTGILAQTTEESDEVGILIEATVEGTDSAIVSDDFSTEIKEVRLDDDGTLLIADAGNQAIYRVDLDESTLTTVQTGLSGPRDILPVGDGNYNITQFSEDNVVQSFLDETEPTELTTTLSLSGPEGIAQ